MNGIFGNYEPELNETLTEIIVILHNIQCNSEYDTFWNFAGHVKCFDFHITHKENTNDLLYHAGYKQLTLSLASEKLDDLKQFCKEKGIEL